MDEALRHRPDHTARDHIIGMLARSAAATPWGIPQSPKNPNHPSNHFLSRASGLQRLHNPVA